MNRPPTPSTDPQDAAIEATDRRAGQWRVRHAGGRDRRVHHVFLTGFDGQPAGALARRLINAYRRFDGQG